MTTNVLILEADQEIAIQIQTIAESLKCSVLGIAPDGKTACRIAKKSPIDLLVGDILSDDAHETIERCRTLQQRQHFGIILVANTADTQSIRQLSLLDIHGYLIKPIHRENLEALIHLAIFKRSVVEDECYFFDTVYCYCLKCTTLFQDNEAIVLNEKEQRLILALIECSGAVLTYEVMEHRIWVGEAVLPNARRQFIYRFRSKVPYFPIKLVKGLGYCIQKSNDEA